MESARTAVEPVLFQDLMVSDDDETIQSDESHADPDINIRTKNENGVTFLKPYIGTNKLNLTEKYVGQKRQAARKVVAFAKVNFPQQD